MICRNYADNEEFAVMNNIIIQLGVGVIRKVKVDFCTAWFFNPEN